MKSITIRRRIAAAAAKANTQWYSSTCAPAVTQAIETIVYALTNPKPNLQCQDLLPATCMQRARM